jgi:hypothetical protein
MMIIDLQGAVEIAYLASGISEMRAHPSMRLLLVRGSWEKNIYE